METNRMGKLILRRQQGVALPVILIILVVMLISSVYLLKSSNSSTLTASNMAYDANLSMAADLGLHAGYVYLKARAPSAVKAQLQQNDARSGYFATYNTAQPVSADAFWTGARTVQAGAGNFIYSVQYVIHRACSVTGAYNAPNNACLQTSANRLAGGSEIAPGQSEVVDNPVYDSQPQLHYIITARIFGPRGGNVVNQMVVLIDA
jgi:Tfp pilus assembly protein PilX